MIADSHRRVARAIAFSLALALSNDVALAISRDRTIAQFHHTTWTAKDGAPSQISALAQTNDGFLWIGSALGLFRFDGVRFEHYAPPDGQALPSHNIYTLMPTSDGGLWVSFRPSGLAFIKDGRITVFDRPEVLPASQVYAFAVDHDRRVWAGTHDGLVLRSGSRWVAVGADWNLPKPERIRALLVGRDGTLWVATDSTVVFLKRGAKKFEATGEVVTDVTSFTEASDGRIWIAAINRSARPLPRDGRPSPSERFEVAIDPVDILLDRDGALWAIHVAEGLRRMRFPERGPNTVVAETDPSIERYREADGLTADVASVLLEDREGSIWVGTAKGLDRFRYGHVVPVSVPATHQKMTLAAGQNGDVWSASATSSTVLRIRENELVIHDVATTVSSVYRNRDGDTWWGGYDGFLRQRGNRFERFSQPRDLLVDWAWEIVRSDEDGGLWVGFGDVGLIHFKEGIWSRPPPPAGLLTRVPSATYHDSQGRIWFGYTENRVCLLDRGHVTRYTQKDGIDIGRIRVIRGRRGPHYWLGGELGLAIFRDGEFHSVAANGGERFGTISGIVETADGTLWLNEIRGIIRIAADEARKVIANPAHRVAYQLFDFLDGMPGSPQMNFTVSTAVEATDGRLWFATDNGLARIDPARLQINKIPPPVSIQSVTAERAYLPAKNLRFPVGTKKIEIRYTALSLAIPERVKFRYLLEGAEEEQWQDAGTRREAIYTNLRPGHYTFRVQAANNDGIWNETGASIALEIPPAFHQTGWFLVLCVVLVACLVWIAYLLRLRQVAARLQRLHDERMDERTRIARELHDTLLQGFLSATMQLHVAHGRLPDDSPAKPILTNVLQLVSDVSEEGRQAVRGLRLSESSESLEEAFGRAKQELVPDLEIGFRVIANGRLRRLHPEVRDEIYRIGREALVNAFQHAEAKNVEVQVEYLDDRLRLRIRDDGRGIDESVLRSGRDDHWGLPGMQERARRIDAQFQVSSRIGAGTEIELSVPSRIAYRRSPRNRSDIGPEG